jgi:hypothetical protein
MFEELGICLQVRDRSRMPLTFFVKIVVVALARELQVAVETVARGKDSATSTDACSFIKSRANEEPDSFMNSVEMLLEVTIANDLFVTKGTLQPFSGMLRSNMLVELLLARVAVCLLGASFEVAVEEFVLRERLKISNLVNTSLVIWSFGWLHGVGQASGEEEMRSAQRICPSYMSATVVLVRLAAAGSIVSDHESKTW